MFLVLALSWVSTPGGAFAQEDGGAAPNLDYAEIMRGQRKLLLGQARALAPQRPGVTDLYFIAFGGEARQDVFMNEVRYARQLFDRRFGTENRSLVLANNNKTLGELPIANRQNLRLALNFISHLIDREEDVVFLFITSHGSAAHELSVAMPPYELDDIDIPMLKKLLDQSKIKWRVVVVSACYSGGFIEPLSNETSLIMTAARHDRTSFGCTNTAKFTYFGRAYFAEALRLEYSFIRAFDIAKNTIRVLERQQRYPESEPQIHVGARIVAKLEDIERRLLSPAALSSN